MTQGISGPVSFSRFSLPLLTSHQELQALKATGHRSGNRNFDWHSVCKDMLQPGVQILEILEVQRSKEHPRTAWDSLSELNRKCWKDLK